MTVDDALKLLKDGSLSDSEVEAERFNEAYNMAIKALEQQPCKDAISRYDALNCVTFNEVRYRMVEDIKALPSVTPKEKTGAWVPIDEEPHEDYECDKCGYVVSTFTANIEPHTEYKYCPNCGARMVSE